MYKTLLSDYDTRQKELLQENAELNKVLQQMKKEMVSILRSKKAILKDGSHRDDDTQVKQATIFSCLRFSGKRKDAQRSDVFEEGIIPVGRCSLCYWHFQK